MKRLIRFFELWLDASCPDCMQGLAYLKDFAAESDDNERRPLLKQFTLTISKKPGTDGKVHEYHLAVID